MLKPKKSLGQHFLRDHNIIRKIATAVKADEDDVVIEIGPGEGALTDYLYPKFKNLHLVEIDSRAVELLKHKFPNANVHHTSVLEGNWQNELPLNGKKYIIGNLPYFITSPILFKVLDTAGYYEQAVFMVQKEVAERLVAKSRTKAYGILSVQTQLLSNTKLLFPVSKEVFYPKPNVDSAVISIIPKKEQPDVDIAFLKTVVRTAFNQRRKKLSNAISSLITVGSQISIDLNKRAEELEPEEFVELAKALAERK
ncbi:MAG: 16S rRNA (adenine(1518)-N(6)/adenine(1519)-N(6))-dimethyltransferase RsmA [Balneolales bacterium]